MAGIETGTRRLRWLVAIAAIGAAVVVTLAVGSDGAPTAEIEADFLARNGEWSMVEVDAVTVVLPADTPGAPAGLSLPADGWEVVVTAEDDGTARSARYVAVGEVFWLVEETGSTVLEGE